MPLRTVALYRWADHVDDDHVEGFNAALDELATVVPQIRAVTYGADTGATGGSFDHTVVIDVATGADWRAVRDHPSYVLLIEEHVTGHVVEQSSGQFRVGDPSVLDASDGDVRELSDDELMARARRAAQASMDALLAEPDDTVI